MDRAGKWPCGALAGLALFLVWGIATGARSVPQMVRSGDYAQVAQALRDAEARRPGDSKVKRNLGIALLEAGDPAGAVAKLRESRFIRPRDPATLFHLGRACERAGDIGMAIEAYGAYLGVSHKNAAAVRARIESLAQQSMRAAARHALQVERDLKLDASSANTVAVPEFHAPVESDTLRPLARGLATILVTDLGRVPSLRVVERARLRILMDELKLASAGSGVVDPGTAPRLGRLLAARRFAQGSLVPTGSAEVQLGALLLDASDASTKTSGTPIAGALEDILILEKRLVFQVIDSLGVPLTQELKRAIGEPPTRSFPAFLAFSRGVEFEERGLMDLARSAYAEAIRIDPGFLAARSRHDELSITGEDQSSIERESVRQAFAPDGTQGRLMETGAEIGLQAIPETPNVRMAPVAKSGTTQLTIKVTLP